MRLSLVAFALLPIAAACGDIRDPAGPTAPNALRLAVSGSTNPRYIVVLRDDTPSPRDVAGAMTQAHGSRADFVYTASIKGFAARLPSQAVDALRRDPRVMMVEPEKLVTLEGVQSPTPSWGLDRIDQRNLPFDNSYTYQRTGAGVHFYGIDSGILTTHNEFTGRLVSGYSAINDGNNTNDCFGHGTHTASTAAGTTYGVAKAMTVVPVRVFDCGGFGGSAEIVAGVDWVTANRVLPAVANMSIGILGGDPPTDSAVARSVRAGIVYVVAAGNKNTDACIFSPAAEPSAITVGATESADYRASFSNYGSCVDIFAPGQQITAAWIGSSTAIAIKDGTSMAAPHVAGVAGQYLEAQPNATPAAVAAALTANATPNKMLNPGAGSPNLILYAGFVTPNVAPAADFTATCTPKHVCTLDASASADGDGTIVSYSWAVDKTRTTSTSPVLTLDLKGNRARAVTLTVTDNSGASTSLTKMVLP
jgi:subtilisin family serine protease